MRTCILSLIQPHPFQFPWQQCVNKMATVVATRGLTRPDLRRTRPKGSPRRESFENSLAQTPEEDPLRILAPAQKKLATIESQRVLAVMDEAIRRMDGALLLPFLADSLQRFSVSLGSVLVSMIEEYQSLAIEYTTLYDALQLQGITPNSRTVSSERELTPRASGDTTKPMRLEPLAESSAEDYDTEERFYQVRHRMKHCAKSILRALNQNPSTSSSLLQFVAKERSRAATQLLDCVTDLHRTVNERLLTTQSEEVKRREQLTRVAERQKDCEEQIRKLEDDLLKAQQHKNEEVCHVFVFPPPESYPAARVPCHWTQVHRIVRGVQLRGHIKIR